MLIRTVRPGDFPAVAELTVGAYEADGQLGDESAYAAVLADVATRAEHGEVLVAVDEVTGAVLGSVTFTLPGGRYAEISRPGEAEFRMLAVAPSAQGRGVGEALVRACLSRAAECGCTAVAICVRDGLAASAHRLYTRLGFVRVPERDWSPLPGVDLLALRLDLLRSVNLLTAIRQ
ncbi:GNAT family N-acetyltransferase [Micromonospora cathayae]|uniref:GNAT family N-acetyltransferase n=1 Tax=Micromonospora cathayae TaxID=3028804 RepID=A0ABY7ZTJ1_9ACTN|nr:GNAT family N-acetyltransferase [Micromonospora sp. HUAS 3]WDZ85119.1 GNAT family N-acetyltransferase [Micromonospora sp. HUAS 3]